MSHFSSLQTLENALPQIEQSPSKTGQIALIVCRPSEGQRKVLDSANLDTKEGLTGDNWLSRGHKKGPANPEMQINIMNARTISVIAGDKTHWPLAGDQFFVDFDLSKENLPPGTQLRIGEAIIEVTAEPHLGCKKFSERFGKDAVMFVNSDAGKALNLRGINAKVIVAGTVNTGDAIQKM